MKTVFVLMDAFRHDYISESETPFLKKMTQSGTYIERLRPGIGFCERSEIFTGVSSEESGFITAIGYSKSKSFYKLVGPILKCLSVVKRGTFISKVLRRLIWEFVKRRNGMHPYNIPFDFLPYFSLTEDQYDMFDTNLFPLRSIFNEIEENNLTVNSRCFTSLKGDISLSDEEKLLYIQNNISSKSDLFLLYLDTPDKFGHKFAHHQCHSKKR